jgi:fibronectin-binding autotransporter adhesin
VGTLTLTRDNTYWGNTIINEGVVQLGGTTTSVSIPDGAGKGNIVLNGGDTVAGTFNLNNSNEVINGLQGTSGAFQGRVVNDIVDANIRILTLGAHGRDASFAGDILDNSGGGLLGRIAITKIGRGTQTLSGTNSFTGAVTAYNGNLAFDFSGGAVPLGGQSLIFGNGTVTIIGDSTGTTELSLSSLSLNSITASKLVIDSNGGSGTTVTTTGAWSSGSGTSSLFIDLSSGSVLKTAAALPTADGNSIAIKNGIVMVGTSTGGVNSYRGGVIVQDATGIGFAMQDAGTLEIRRYTDATALTATSTQSGSANHYIMNQDVDHTGANFLFSTLTMDTGSTFTPGTGIELDLGTRQMLTTSGFNGHSLLVIGANDATVTGTTATVMNSLFVSNYGTGALTIDINMNGQALVANGPGLVIYNRANVPGDVYVEGGVVRINQDMEYTGNTLRILGGILELGSDQNGAAIGDFSRSVGGSPSNVAIIGDGGFSAFGGDRLVSLGGDTPSDLTWGASNFLVSAAGGDVSYTLKLGSEYSDSTLEFANAINLGTRERFIEVADGVVDDDVDARLTGVLSSASGALTKIGDGTLETTAANTYGMGTSIEAGRFLANNTSGSATGTGHVTVLSGATLGGTGTVTASTGTQHITVNSGATLMVGDTHGVATSSGGVASSFNLQTSDGGVITLGGTVELDLFGNTNNGSGTNPDTDNDVLHLTSDNSVVLDGILAIIDTTGTSLSWGLGSTWLLIDWAAVSATTHNSGTFDDVLLPTLNTGLEWDTSKLYIDGTISVAAVIPEPGRAMLLMAGMASLLLRRRRARN